MKTSILLVAAFTLVAGYSVYQSQQKEQMSDLALANVEALAGGENLSNKIWNREDYVLDNGTPAVNCWAGGTSDCVLR